MFANSHLRQSPALGIGELHTPLNLLAQDMIFFDQILVSHQEFLVYRACDVDQQLLPIHAIALD